MNSTDIDQLVAQVIGTAWPVGDAPFIWEVARRQVSGGLHNSKQPGLQGDELMRRRPWQEEDPERNKDQLSFAMNPDAPDTVEFKELKPVDVIVVVNTGSSMRYGTKRCDKLVVAAEALAAMTLAAKHRNDRIALITYDEAGVRLNIPPRTASTDALSYLVHTMLHDSYQHESDPVVGASVGSQLLQALEGVPNLRRNFVVIVTDLTEEFSDFEQHVLRGFGSTQDVVAIVIRDLREAQMPEISGAIALQGLLTKSLVSGFLSKSTRLKYAERYAAAQTSLAGLLEDANISSTFIGTEHDGGDIVDQVQELFFLRRGQRL